jgi:hypothetical protein
MLDPIAWLANASFAPAWRPGLQPVPPPTNSRP